MKINFSDYIGVFVFHYLKEAVKRCKEKLQGAKDSLFNLPNDNVSSVSALVNNQ